MSYRIEKTQRARGSCVDGEAREQKAHGAEAAAREDRVTRGSVPMSVGVWDLLQEQAKVAQSLQ